MKFNIGIILVIVMAALASLAVLPSCQPIKAMFNGSEQTREQIEIARKAEAAATAAEVKEKERKAAEDVRLAQDEHDRAVRAIERTYQSKVREVAAGAEQAKGGATDEYQAAIDDVGGKFVAKVATINSTLSVDVNKSLEALNASKTAADLAIKSIEAGEAQRAKLFEVGGMVINNPLVATAAGAVPGGSSLLTLAASVLGLGGLGTAIVAKKQTKEANTQAVKSKKATQSIVRGLENAKKVDSTLSELLKKHAGTILKEVTDEAHTIIENKGMDPTT